MMTIDVVNNLNLTAHTLTKLTNLSYLSGESFIKKLGVGIAAATMPEQL